MNNSTSPTTTAKRKLFSNSPSPKLDVEDFKKEIHSRLFMMQLDKSQRWNFDFVNENPLPGPFKWHSSLKYDERNNLTDFFKGNHMHEPLESNESTTSLTLLSQPCFNIRCKCSEDSLNCNKICVQNKITDYFRIHKSGSSHQPNQMSDFSNKAHNHVNMIRCSCKAYLDEETKTTTKSQTEFLPNLACKRLKVPAS